MEIFGLLFVVVALLLVGVGIALGCMACVALVVLLMLGIFSSATSVGLYRRSASAGFRTFVYLFCVALGVPAGILCASLLASEWSVPGGVGMLVAGSLGGIASGMAVAFFTCGVTRRLLVPRER